MKEAAGEANLTVVAIILIGVVVAVVTPLVNSLMSTAAERACCTDAGGYWQNSKCQGVSGAYYNAETKQCTSGDTTGGTPAT